ncbi:MAG: transcription elongation factor GreA [Acidimicrobiales bacterium]|nr:transcription elongation factor GreA [Acidimicrobiales bacterium]RZV46447.1 MAG: transcription elongation factor GreA [Acidimicrobiales bacterium]
MAQNKQLTQATFDRLHAEHEDLTTRGRIDIARKIETARELGDLSENGDYHAAKEEQGKMEGRIMFLAKTIDEAEIVEATGGDEVSAGSVVELRYEGDDDTEKFLVGSIEERQEGLENLSPGSPLGEALMGAKAGDSVSYETPAGMTLSVEVVSVA